MRELVERAIEERGVVRGAATPRTHRPRRSVSVHVGESPLSWLRAHGKIDARQFEAGERLRADY